MTRKLATVLVALGALLLMFQGAQAYPDRPIKLVVGSPAGSPPDVMARLLTDKMTSVLGQPVIVENRPGAGGTIGAKSVLAAEPDGYTLMLGSTSTLFVAPAMYKNAGYDAESFTPISRVADSSEVLAVHPSVAAKSIAELISLAKSKPGTLNFASAGNGTLPHVEGEFLKAQAKIELNHIPYRGGGNALTGLVAGQVQIMFSTLTQMLPYIREGRLRGLAISSATRSKLAPEIPTMVESGFPQFVTTSVNLVVAPPKTPIEIRRQLSKAVVAALASDEAQQALARLGGEARPSTPEETAVFLAAQQKQWSGIIKATQISID
jgi:tripartite-type tricarboxylate transporter receptor subunit TctC